MSASTQFGVQVLFQNQTLYDRTGGDVIAGMKAHIDAAAELGVELIRFPGDWRALQPTSADSFDSFYLKQVVETLAYAQTKGIAVSMTFAQTPFWATDKSHDPDSQAAIWSPPTGASAVAYAKALVTLHDTIEKAGLLSSVKAWEVWNEPNTTTFWPTGTVRAGTDVQVNLEAAKQYVALLNTAYDALKATDADAVVLGGSLAACDTDYLNAMYAAGAKFDGLALHPYTKANPFHDGIAYGPTETNTQDALSQVWSFKTGVEHVRDVMVAHGDASKAMWFTEFGWSSSSAWGGAGSAAAQAEFLGEALKLVQGWDFVDAAIAYRLFDGQGEEFGMRTADGTLKASGLVFKDFLANLPTTTSATMPATMPAPSAMLLPAYSTLSGSDSADVLTGTEVQDIISGNGGDDRLDGKGGNDVIIGGEGDNTIFGGAGNDKLTGGGARDWIEGGAGADTMVAGGYHGHLRYWSSTAGVTVNLQTGVAHGGHAEGDTFYGFIAVDGSQHADTLTGSNGDNWVIGLGGNDVLSGLAGRDRIDGGTGNDRLSGGSGADHMIGGAGNDRLSGGLGADKLIGGAGYDTFLFASAKESAVGASARDIISDFLRGQDHIDLSRIDANLNIAGNQAFKYIGAQGFHHRAGELHMLSTKTGGIIEGDINGDGHADFQIQLTGTKMLAATDFIL